MDSSPKLLLLGSQMETGGAQRLLLDQAYWFTSNGWQVTVAFLYDKEGLHEKWQSDASYPIINLEAKKSGKNAIINLLALIKGLSRLSGIMQSQHFDAIETFTHHANLIGLPLAWLYHISTRVGSHHGHILGFSKYLEKIHAGVVNIFATHLVAVGQNVQKEAIKEGIRKDKITVISNGVNLTQTSSQITRKLRESIGCKNGMLVLTAGRMTYQKAQTFFLKAAAQVLPKHPATIFALAGDGPLRQELEEEARLLGIADNVRFLGIRSDLLHLMAAADIFALSSRWEGLPMVLLEAMGMGTVVISTRGASAEEVIRNHENGELVEPENAEALAIALDQLLSNNELRQQMASAGQETILKGYTMHIMCQKYAKLLKPST